MKRTQFYSLDFSASLSSRIGRMSAGVWFVILLVAVLVAQYAIWIWDEFHKPTLGVKIAELDGNAAPIAALHDDWQKAIKRYAPLQPLMEAAAEEPVASIASRFDRLVSLAPFGGKGYSPDLSFTKLSVVRGEGGEIGFRLALPAVDREDERERCAKYIVNCFDAVQPQDGREKASVSVSWDDGGRITQETESLSGRVSLRLGGRQAAAFPPVAKDVDAAYQIVKKWQTAIHAYKFKKRVPWYSKPMEWYAGTSGASSGEPDFNVLETCGGKSPEFERAVATHVDPLRICDAAIRALTVAATNKEGKARAVTFRQEVEKYADAWRRVANETNPFRRDKTLDWRVAEADATLISQVAVASVKRAEFVSKCAARAEEHLNALKEGVQYKHVYGEQTFRDRVILPPVREALSAAAAGDWKVGLVGVVPATPAEAALPVFFPRWEVRASPEDRPANGAAPSSPAAFVAVRGAVAGIEGSPAHPWATRVDVEFAPPDGLVRRGWPHVTSFRVEGRVPCWRGAAK